MDETCRVCKKFAVGMHYGVWSCEGCKAFFKRTVTQNACYICPKDCGLCSTHYQSKPVCRACRFKKCLEVGMSLSKIQTPRGAHLFKLMQADRGKKLKSPVSKIRSVSANADSQPTARVYPDSESTSVTVAAAGQFSFYEQTMKWTELTACNSVPEPLSETQSFQPSGLENVLDTMNQHNVDQLDRIQTFASMLPGIQDFTAEICLSTSSAWKIFISMLIHQATFVTSLEAYLTIMTGKSDVKNLAIDLQSDHKQIELFSFILKLCTFIRDMGLDQTGRYLLMAVILCEPDKSGDGDSNLHAIHRHYLNALVDHVKPHGLSASNFVIIGDKLADFFGALVVVERFVQEHCQTKENSAPFVHRRLYL